MYQMNGQYTTPTKQDLEKLANKYNTNKTNEIIRRIIKYLIAGFAVAILIYYFIDTTINKNNLVKIGLISAVVFMILDMISPTISIHIK